MSPEVRKRKCPRLLLILSSLLFCLTLLAQAAVLVDFEDPPLGTVYTLEQTIRDSGITANVISLVFSDGTTVGSGRATIVADGRAGGQGKEIFIRSVSLEFKPAKPVDEVSFLFASSSGLSLVINGHYNDYYRVEDLINQNGKAVDGVMVKVTAKTIQIKGTPGYKCGMIKLSAHPNKITSFSVGGAGVSLDNVAW